MTNLTDTQRILLASAAQRDNGSLLPLPNMIAPGGGAAKALAALVKRRLAEERETKEPATVHREADDVRFGLFVTAAGLSAIGVELPAPGDDHGQAVASSPVSARSKAASKIAIVADLLSRSEGAVLTELIAATGWLPHTTRAALTGLRKKGHAIERTKRGDLTCYRIVVAG